MDKSETIANLAAALTVFQGKNHNAFKGSQGHGYSYADLGAILDQCRALLAENGLSVVQMPVSAEAGYVGVETMIAHSSGEWVSNFYQMAVPENKRNSAAQNIGSAITYARRYALAAALGIAQTDDDAATELVVSHTDKQWVDAVKADPEVLNQIQDPAYKKRIQELMA